MNAVSEVFDTVVFLAILVGFGLGVGVHILYNWVKKELFS
jgi:hypothetical protein